MPSSAILSKPQPLLGMLLVAVGWAVSHQWGSNGVFDDCAGTGGVGVVLTSLLGLVLVGFGALYSFAAGRSGGTGRRFLGLLGALLASIAAFAIVLQIAAGLILPPCAA